MTFEIKGLVDMTTGTVQIELMMILPAKELLEHPETRLRTRRLLPADVPMVWWIDDASLAFRAGGQTEKRLLLADHRSLDCLHVPAKQLPSRAPVLPSRSHRKGNQSETQGVRRWAARGQASRSRVRDVKHK